MCPVVFHVFKLAWQELVVFLFYCISLPIEWDRCVSLSCRASGGGMVPRENVHAGQAGRVGQRKCHAGQAGRDGQRKCRAGQVGRDGQRRLRVGQRRPDWTWRQRKTWSEQRKKGTNSMFPHWFVHHFLLERTVIAFIENGTLFQRERFAWKWWTVMGRWTILLLSSQFEETDCMGGTLGERNVLNIHSFVWCISCIKHFLYEVWLFWCDLMYGIDYLMWFGCMELIIWCLW